MDKNDAANAVTTSTAYIRNITAYQNSVSSTEEPFVGQFLWQMGW